jgi:hypothetical protein
MEALMETDPRPNPYVWQGDHLIHAGKGYAVASIDDFPQIGRARALNARANQMRREGRMGRELFR